MAVVAVLGCGPAGLFAAQALALNGFDPVIMSKKQKSLIYGAQYLHKPIPGISPQLPTGTIKTFRAGSREVYAERVYGLGTHPTSWDRVVPQAPAWDLRESYDCAWEIFKDRIVDVTIGADEVAEFTSQFDLVISTIPAWSICAKPSQHFFKSLPIIVKKGIDLTGIALMAGKLLGSREFVNDWVIYNGTHDLSWYRASNIFGHTSIEARPEPHLEHDKEWDIGFKVVGNDCDCHPALVKAGRMGLWRSGVLTHHAFETTIESIAAQFGTMYSTHLS